MPLSSVFCFSCICGREFQNPRQETFRCPDCGRLLVIEWGRDDNGEPFVVRHAGSADVAGNETYRRQPR
jgi:DNA-directed RNA polymerase subunit RPC12/RpoP